MLKLKNDGATTLAADISSAVTSITVTDGSVFPALATGDWFPLTLIKNSSVERMRVTARSGNALTVTRGVEGTTAQSWASGDSCTCNLTESAIKSASAYALAELSGGMVVNRIDANGNNNVMLKVPMFTLDAVNTKLGTSMGTGPHPAFIRPDGSIMTHFEYGIYLASNDGANNPVSVPFADPYASISFDNAKAKCAAMGPGWHLAHNSEWAAIVWLCLMNGWDSLGNTNYGRSHSQLYQAAIRQDGLQAGDASGTARTLTGTGPLSWRHNGQLNGIADLVGNVWEWQDGFKQDLGQIIVADKNTSVENDWIAQAAYYNGDEKLANAKTSDNTGISEPWSTQQKDANYVDNALLQALLIEPVPAASSVLGNMYCNNTITGFPVRGGIWYHGSNAGIGALNLHTSRSYAHSSIGFRPAFFE